MYKKIKRGYYVWVEATTKAEIYQYSNRNPAEWSITINFYVNFQNWLMRINLILKGRLFIYTLTNFESRATIAVNFLLWATSNSIDDMKVLITRILNISTSNNYIYMKAKGFKEIYYLTKNFDFDAIITDEIQKFLEPVFELTVNGKEWFNSWVSQSMIWTFPNER